MQKMGIPFRQMHSWDYSGPYHGYDGFAIFARDMDLAINNPVWGLFDRAVETETVAELLASRRVSRIARALNGLRGSRELQRP